jgi:hypothetical protein
MKLPQQNERVFVVVGDVRLPSRVQGTRGGDIVMVAPPSRNGVRARLVVGEAVAIEWTTGRGLFRGEGIVAPQAEDSPVLWIRLDVSKIAQRREHIRADISVEIELTQTAGIPVAGRTIDLSGGGMRAKMPLDLVAGERVEFKVYVPDEAPVAGVAEVIRGTEGTGYAFRFVWMQPADRERLIRYVFAEHRREFATVRIA